MCSLYIADFTAERLWKQSQTRVVAAIVFKFSFCNRPNRGKCSQDETRLYESSHKCHVFHMWAQSTRCLLMLVCRKKKEKKRAEVFLGELPGLLSGNRGQIKNQGRSPRGIVRWKKTLCGLNKRHRLLVKYTSTYCRPLKTHADHHLLGWNQFFRGYFLQSHVLKRSDWACGEPWGFLCLGLADWNPELNDWLP